MFVALNRSSEVENSKFSSMFLCDYHVHTQEEDRSVEDFGMFALFFFFVF